MPKRKKCKKRSGKISVDIELPSEPIGAKLVLLAVLRGQFVKDNADLARCSSPSIEPKLRENQQRMPVLVLWNLKCWKLAKRQYLR